MASGVHTLSSTVSKNSIKINRAKRGAIERAAELGKGGGEGGVKTTS